MISALIKKYKERKAIQQWNSSHLAQSLAKHTDDYFVKNPRMSGFSEEAKDKLINELYQKVFSRLLKFACTSG